MSDAQVEDLQIRLAHQELAIEALNETVVRQDAQIAELREQVRRLIGMLRDLNASPVGDGHEPPPPHY